MKLSPLSVGTLHFVGIGGIGMSGLAEILHNLGQSVQGSDTSENANVERLRKLGVPVHVGHHKGNIGDARIVVASTAIPDTNPEIKEARRQKIPVIKRSEVLAQIMRLKWSISVTGTHGKTTTTSLIASVLSAAGADPTVINGGIVHDYGTNVHLGKGEWLVAEADESDGTFLRIPSTIAVITNISPEHLSYYGTYENLKNSFRSFIQNIPFYGFGVLCIDDEEIRDLIPTINDREIITYGFHEKADVQATNLSVGKEGITFDVNINKPIGSVQKTTFKNLFLPMAGEHNVQNSLSAITIALKMDINIEAITQGLNKFNGVSRRFTKTGEVNGVTIIDDYAHHPVEIKAVLKAARAICSGRIIAVMQPHRFSRLADLFGDFCVSFDDANDVVVVPIHSAGEKPILGASRDALVEGIKSTHPKGVYAVDTLNELAPLVSKLAKEGDMVIFLGAGSITQWAHQFPDALKNISDDSNVSSIKAF